MNLRMWRFLSIMSTAVTVSAALCHLMELPPKMRYAPPVYVKLHRTLYPNFGRIAGMAEILAVLSTSGLAWSVRKRSIIAAAGCLAAAHGAFWALVNPANVTMANWPLDAIPPDWTRWRDQWEYTHASRAVLTTGALGMLVWSSLQEIPHRIAVRS
jgi:hypothetical protein